MCCQLYLSPNDEDPMTQKQKASPKLSLPETRNLTQHCERKCFFVFFEPRHDQFIGL